MRKIMIQMDTAHYEKCHEERGKKENWRNIEKEELCEDKDS
jgi:hypothetical protein